MVQVQAYKQVFARTSAYFFGAYLFGPRESPEVASRIPGTPVVHLAVPDVYSARAGIAYALAPARGISLSLGGRIDGIPQADLIGGRDNNFRRPGYSLYLDPGIALRRGGGGFTFGVAVPGQPEFQRSSIDPRRSVTGGGGAAGYPLVLG